MTQDALATDVEIDVVDVGEAAAAPLQEAERLAHEATLSPPAVAARLLHQAGWVLERTGDRAGAAKRYAEARARDATYRPALDSLRRVRAEEGAWDEVARLYEEDVPFQKDAAGQAETLRALAGVLSRRLGRHEEAAKALQRALQLVPEHVALLDWAVEDAQARGEKTREIELRLKLAKLVKDERLKARHLSQAARLRDALGDADGAKALRKELLDIFPLDAQATASLVPELRAKHDGQALERLARAEVEASSGSTTRVRLAKILAAREAYDEALEVLKTAREINPRDALALEALIDVAERKGDRAAATAHLTARSESARDPLDKAQAALRLARAAEAAGDVEQAKAHYQKVLELAPEHPEALRAPARLADRENDLAALLQRAQDELAKAADSKAKAELSYKLGALHDERTGEVEKAVAAYLDALAADPGHLGARNALVRLYDRAGKYQELAQFYEKEYLVAPSEEQKHAAIVEMAEVMETRLNDVTSAAAAYRMALELRPDAATARALVRCALAAKKTRDVAFGLEQEASCTTGSRQQITLLHRAAELYQRELKKPQDAARLHERIRQIDPTYLPSLRALGTLYKEAGDHAALAKLLLDDAKAAEPARAASLALDAARVALAHQAWEVAAEALRLALQHAPKHPTAWGDLARVAVARGDFAHAAEALEKQAALLTDGLSKGDAYVRAAELWEERLGDAARAEKACELAAAAAPRHAAAWRMLSRLALARGDVARAISALEQEVAVTQLKDRSTAMRRLAALLADRANEQERAIQLLRQLFEEDNADMWAIAELERLLRESGERVKSAEFRSRLAARCADQRAAAALRISSAIDRLEAGDTDAAVNEFRRALALDGRARAAADEVLLALRAKGDRAGILDLLQRTAPYFDNDSQAVLHFMRGELYEQDGQIQLAQRCFRDAAAADPALLPAMREARRLHEAAGEWTEARALLAQEGEAHADAVEGVRLIVHAGELAEKMRDQEQAEAHYLRALQRVPGEPTAMARLDVLLRPQGRFSELVTIYEREGEALADDLKRSAQHYAEAAWLRYEKLGEDRRAAVPLNRALARDPQCTRALELKALIAVAEKRGAEAEEALAAALKTAPAEDRPRLLTRLAEARLAMGHAALAFEAAQEAATAHETPEALELLARAALAAQQLDAAQAAADKLVVTAADRVSGARHARLGGAVRRAKGDVAGASQLYRRALELLPGDREALEGLEQVHLDAGDFGGLASAYEALATASAADPASAMGYLTRAAGVWERAQAPSRAAAVYRTALKGDPQNGTLRLSLARTLATSPALRAEAIAELRTLAAQTPAAPEPYRQLVAVYDAEGKKDAAFVALGALVALGVANDAEKARHAELLAKVPALPQGALGPEDIDTLVHPQERTSPVREVFAAIGGELAAVIPVDLEAEYGVQRSSGFLGMGRDERLKGEVKEASDLLAKLFGAPAVELYPTAKRPFQASVENSDPPTAILGAQLLQLPARELRFHLGRLAARLRQRTFVAYRATPLEVATLVAESLRQIDPTFSRFGGKSDELGRALGKALSRGARKLLEGALPKFAGAVNFAAFTQAMHFTSHRFGLVAAGDLAAALSVLLRDDGKPISAPADKPEVRELLVFALSDEHLALRQKLKLALA